MSVPWAVPVPAERLGWPTYQTCRTCRNMGRLNCLKHMDWPTPYGPALPVERAAGTEPPATV